MAPSGSIPYRVNPFGWPSRPTPRRVEHAEPPEPDADGALGPELAFFPTPPPRPRPGIASWLEAAADEPARAPARREPARTVASPPGALDLSEARAIFDCGRFWTEYQAIVNVRSGRTAAFEALGRFSGSDGAPVAPAELFALLHADPALLLRAELTLKFHQIEHAPSAPVFLNLDPDSWWRAGDGDRNPFIGLLAQARTRVVVEVTESVVASNAVRVADMVTAMRAQGLTVALDDLGASDGLLSFDAIAQAEVLKFDRAMVPRLREPRCRALVQALIRMSHETGAYTVLEGVEKAADFVAARETGFDLVQGFLFKDRAQVALR